MKWFLLYYFGEAPWHAVSINIAHQRLYRPFYRIHKGMQRLLLANEMFLFSTHI